MQLLNTIQQKLIQRLPFSEPNSSYCMTRVANRPGMAGTVPELTSDVPCLGLGHFCPGIY